MKKLKKFHLLIFLKQVIYFSFLFFFLTLSINLAIHSKVMDVFIKAAEYVEMPVRRTDNDPLQKIFGLVRSELNLDLKNIKQEQAKFWKQHPALVKVTSSQCDFVR